MVEPLALLGPGMRRAGLWLVIVAIHAGALILANQWSPPPQPAEATPIEAQLLTEVAEPMPQPQVSVPDLSPISLPRMEMPVVQLPQEPAPTAITVAMVTEPPPAAPPPAPQNPAAPRLVSESEVSYLEAPKPHYPTESRRFREEGLVVLRVLVDELGRARHIDVERSSGHARLDEAARVAVSRAVFRPFMEGGVARPVMVMIPIEFALKSRSARHAPARHGGGLASRGS